MRIKRKGDAYETFRVLFAPCRIGGAILESKGVSFDAYGNSFTSVDDLEEFCGRAGRGYRL